MDLTKLFSNVEEKIKVEETLSFTKEELENTGIEALEDVFVSGCFFKNSVGEIECDLKVSGKFILQDAISCEPVPYPFSFSLQQNVEELVEKDKNTLAFKPFLWENIVLEVPIRYTTVQDYNKYQGDGWRLTSEEEVRKGNHPFEELLKQREEE